MTARVNFTYGNPYFFDNLASPYVLLENERGIGHKIKYRIFARSLENTKAKHAYTKIDGDHWEAAKIHVDQLKGVPKARVPIGEGEGQARQAVLDELVQTWATLRDDNDVNEIAWLDLETPIFNKDDTDQTWHLTVDKKVTPSLKFQLKVPAYKKGGDLDLYTLEVQHFTLATKPRGPGPG